MDDKIIDDDNQHLASYAVNQLTTTMILLKELC